MIEVELYDIETNKPLNKKLMLAQAPSYDDYIMDSKEIMENWKDYMYSVKGVTYFDGGRVIVHVVKYNPEKTMKDMETVLRRLSDATKHKDSEKKAS